MGIYTPFPYSYVSKALINDLGVAVERSFEFTDNGLYRRYGLGSAVFFDREHFA